MRFFNTRPTDQQRLAVLVPIIALGLSLFVVYPQWQEYREMVPKVEQAKKELATLKATPPPPDVPGIAAVPAAPSEPPEFMGEVTQLAVEANCHVTGFDLTPPTAAASAAVGPVQAVSSQIIVTASYADIRNFVALVARSPRVLSITDVAIAPAVRSKNVLQAPNALQATVQIERYVLAQ